jgi:hypothetical protein
MFDLLRKFQGSEVETFIQDTQRYYDCTAQVIGQNRLVAGLSQAWRTVLVESKGFNSIADVKNYVKNKLESKDDFNTFGVVEESPPFIVAYDLDRYLTTGRPLLPSMDIFRTLAEIDRLQLLQKIRQTHHKSQTRPEELWRQKQEAARKAAFEVDVQHMKDRLAEAKSYLNNSPPEGKIRIVRQQTVREIEKQLEELLGSKQ